MAKKTEPGSTRKTEAADPKAKPAVAEAKPVVSERKEDTSSFPALGRWLMFVDNPKNVDRICYSLYVLCAGLFLADFIYHKHVEFKIEYVPGFYALYGFFMCAALVICARMMRIFLKRPEDYYAPYDVESEDYPEDGLDKDAHNG